MIKKRKRKLEEEDKSFALALQIQQDWKEDHTKEKKSKVESMSIIPLPFGVILFKNCLSEDEQIGVYNICDELHRDKNNAYRNGLASQQNYPVPMLMFNWNGKKNEKIPQPTDLLEFGKMMFKKAYKYAVDSNVLKEEKNPNYKCPSSYNPDALYAILYSEKAALQGHFDGALGWVLSVSIGNSVLFTISDSNKGEEISIQLDSGDIVLFNGTKVWHSVKKVFPNTSPKFWKTSAVNNYGFSRFNLQFRDPSTWNQNK